MAAEGNKKDWTTNTQRIPNGSLQFSVPYSVYSVSLWFKIYFPANRTAAAPLNGSSTARKQASVMETIHAPNGELTYRVIGLAMRVHRHLGPGLLKSAYEKCLCYELAQADIPFRSQVPLPIHYNQVSLDCGYIADLLVDNQVILELKAAKRILPIHEAQLLTYLRIAGCRTGLLINFNTIALKDGIKRRVL